MAGSLSAARGPSASTTCASCASGSFPKMPGPMSHPVRPDSYVAIDNFYTTTVYEKAPTRAHDADAGRPRRFDAGITEYFRRHDGQAVTCDAFAQAIADVNPASR